MIVLADPTSNGITQPCLIVGVLVKGWRSKTLSQFAQILSQLLTDFAVELRSLGLNMSQRPMIPPGKWPEHRVFST